MFVNGFVWRVSYGVSREIIVYFLFSLFLFLFSSFSLVVFSFFFFSVFCSGGEMLRVSWEGRTFCWPAVFVTVFIVMHVCSF